MEGLEAEANRIETESLQNILNIFPRIITTPASILSKSFGGLVGIPLISALEGGSFTFTLDLRLHRRQLQMQLSELFFDFEENIKLLFDKYVQYCFNDLPDEFLTVLREKSAPKFEEVLKEFEEFTTIAAAPMEDMTERFYQETVKIPELIAELTEHVGTSYTSMELTGVYPIAKIDNQVKSTYDQLIEIIDTELTEIDSQPRDYRIHIYSLNVDSRKGKAYVVKEDQPDQMLKARIKILGVDALENTKYTGSLHENKFIKVKATGKRTEDVLISMDIEFEK